MKKNIIIGLISLFALTACETYDRQYYTLGLTKDDIIGTWETSVHHEEYGGEVGYDGKITWEISGSQIKESIYKEAWDFQNDGIITDTKETYSFEFEQGNLIKFDGRTYRIDSWNVNDSRTTMELAYDEFQTETSVGASYLTFQKRK